MAGANLREYRWRQAMHLKTQLPCRNYIWSLKSGQKNRLDRPLNNVLSLNFYPLKRKTHDGCSQEERVQGQFPEFPSLKPVCQIFKNFLQSGI